MPPPPALANQFTAAKGRSLVTVQARLVAIAKERHAKVMAREPRPDGFTRIVDGQIGVREELVKAAGLIVYRYIRNQIGFALDIRQTRARLDEVAQFALATLRGLSPVGGAHDPHPGRYRDSHKLFVNGYPADDLSGWNEGDEISITNYVEYSRILEVGNGRHRIPNKVYEIARDVVGEKYGTAADIEFTWRGITAGLQIAQSPSDRRGFGVRVAATSRAHNKSPTRYPTLVIKPRAVSSTLRRLGTAVVLGVADAVVERALAPSNSGLIGHG